jgi:hypothetical protein
MTLNESVFAMAGYSVFRHAGTPDCRQAGKLIIVLTPVRLRQIEDTFCRLIINVLMLS